jgi:hypothetical protein
MAPAHVTASFAGDPLAEDGLGRVPAGQALRRAGHGLFWLLIVLIGFDLVEPAPYDFVAAPVILLWLALGLRLSRHAVLFVALLLLYRLGVFLAVVPHLDQRVSVMWTVTSVYLMMTGIFFVMFFSDETLRRIELALQAYVVSCFVTASAGIIGYFGIAGTADLFTRLGRASGTFEDPNVFGSFLIPGALYLSRRLITGEGRRPVRALLTLPVLLTGIFLSFSRGAWITTLLAGCVLLAIAFATAPTERVRRRIALVGVTTAVVGAMALGWLLSLDAVGGMFEERAQIVQDYDSGVTGRFGNQLRAIPMLLELPNGFGPLRYRFAFGFDPHNSFISGFANGGWITGFAFIGMMLVTTVVGFRSSIRPSPYQRHAQIVFAAQITLLIQSFQIDIDHWRHVYLIWGMIWGLHVARMRWSAAQGRAAFQSWRAPATSHGMQAAGG